MVCTCEEEFEVVSIQNLQLHWMKAREVRSDDVVASARLPSWRTSSHRAVGVVSKAWIRMSNFSGH